ncbi:efflux RND transporter periplasmic adaptor subunit [Pseudomonas sp. JS3066]|uniref:efflux RND transporter periplasmic adaptor subunit n=1 Tax=unclassified Pseudomonas TaxID=196821 RepID=UPI00129D2A3D|nr:MULTISPECIES: efflux RND transporter periplasmic adaptor subunit [unclassified Pseudomonas]MDH4653895.1 efflux RND transporter periplasmic adaptor subunit [Pseudomonas sp. BN606]MRK22700.1 efflux RND transporter periplasmic adaptor subunit [Pseudomonas sp. JG-B]WVK90961.1 efflux RND transporter periplasmic adaptor subunit [Pseudomonas sp. JS3066]
MMVRRSVWLLFGALASLSAVAQEAPLVEVAEPQRALVRDELVTFGSLRSDESVMIRPEIEGRVASLHFREGEAVKGGELLISLDDAIARAELAQAQANLDLAEKSYERAKMLFARGASNAQAQDESQSQQQAARASLALAQARLEKTQIRAPYDGTLGLRQVSVGDYLSAGQDMVNLEVLDPLKVDFRVPQKAVSQVSIGQLVELSLDAYPGERFRGEIIALNPRLDEVGRSQAIRAQVGNRDHRLKPGQFVKVSVILAERPQALLIPEEAVMPVGQQLFVNLVVDGKVERRQIKIGQRLRGKAEVREGLQGNEQVITAGWQKVSPGLEVRTVARGGA